MRMNFTLGKLFTLMVVCLFGGMTQDAFAGLVEVGKYYNIITGSSRAYAKNQPVYVTDVNVKLSLGTYDLEKNDPTKDPYAVWVFETCEDGYAIKNVQTGQYMGAYNGDGFENAPVMSNTPSCYYVDVYKENEEMVTLRQKGATYSLKADQSNKSVLNHEADSDWQHGWILKEVDAVSPLEEEEDENVFKEGYYHFISAYGPFENTGVNDYKRAMLCLPDSVLQWAVYYNTLIDNRDNPAYLWHVTKNDDGTYYIQNVQTGCYVGLSKGEDQEIPASVEPVKQVISALGDGQWDVVAKYWKDQGKDYELYTNFSNSANNSAGPMCSYYTGKNGRGAWYVNEITDQTAIAAMKEAAVQNMMTHNVRRAYDEARRVYNKLYTYEMGTKELLTEADDDDASHNQFWGTFQPDTYSYYRHLVDGDLNTCFQSSWENTIEQPQWLQVDLRDNPVKDFTFYFGLRNDNEWGPAMMWIDVTIFGTNDESIAKSEAIRNIQTVEATEGWDKIGDFDDLPIEYAKNYKYNTGWYYAINGLCTKEYRFIRFYVNSTYDRQSRNQYSLGEFQVYENKLNEEASPINTIDGLKELGEQFMAKFEECKKAITSNTGTEELYKEMRRLNAEVWAMMPDVEALEKYADEVNSYVSLYNDGESMGDVDTETWDEVQEAIYNAKNYPVHADAAKIKELQDNLEKAFANFKAKQKKVDPDKWYFIVSQDKTNVGSYGNAIYMKTGNCSTTHWSDFESMTWGYYQNGGEEYTSAANPFSMWRFIPVSEEDDTYLIQNRASGRYIGYTYNTAGRQGVSEEKWAYKVVYMKSGQVKLVCQDPRNTGEAALNAMPTKFINSNYGNADSPVAWDLEEVIEEDYENLYLYYADNSINIVSLPYALDDEELTKYNEEEGWTMYGVKYYHPEDLTLGLVKKTTVKAGEPFILVKTGETGSTELVPFAIPMIAGNYTKEEGEANGLHAIFDYKTKQNTMCYFVNGQLAEVKSDATAFNAYSGVLDLKAVVDPNPEVEADLVLQTPADYSLVRALNFQKGGLVNVFTIDGKLVKKNVKSSNATENLDKGIYVVGEKKVSVK